MPIRPARRIIAVATVSGLLVAGAVVTATGVTRPGDLVGGYDADVAATQAAAREAAAEAETHSHADSATKNAISRAGETSQDAQDPTGAAEKIANAAAVAAHRTTAPPTLASRPADLPRATHPATRYAMANGCYTLTRGGEPIYFKPTDLGDYLLYDAERQFVTTDGTKAAEPSDSTVWTAKADGDRMRFTQGDATLTFEGASRFLLTRAQGCTAYPESQINITGDPFTGTSKFQEVRGYADAHTHGMAFEFLGGGAHCGKPWDRFGAPYALVDCEDHQTGTNPLEAFLSENPSHDPVGWPTFKDWPAPESLTHEGTYYRWMERSWRGGQRLFVNLLVENNQLCQLYPLGPDGTPLSKNSCDDMDSIRLQAQRMYEFQDYVDAQWGGPGKGWYRIVKNPFQARRVINDGKMAIVMGIETSVPFGCTFKAVLGEDVPAAECTKESIDQQLKEVRKLGVRQMELVNKFDNALSGVAGDEGSTGAVVNNANFLETKTYWDMEHCEPEDPEAHDKNQYAAPEISAEQQDALFGAIGQLYGLTGSLPVYPRPDHCNSRGLTELGAHLVKRLVQTNMLVDPDHMSVKARDSLLDMVEDRRYPGVISSHSWSTPDAYPRIYDLGGFIAPYAGDSTGFVDKWRAHVEWANPKYFFGLGFGADMNGLGAQGDPRGADVPNPVTYPFKGLGGVTIEKQHAGQRVYDINVDGVAQYGLYPDWIEDLTKVAESGHRGDGAAIGEDMARGAEAYLQTWERAQGIAPDPCRNPRLRESVSAFQRLVRPGMTTRQVMNKVGQPFLRRDLTYTYCAASASGEVRMSVELTPRGRVAGVRRAG